MKKNKAKLITIIMLSVILILQGVLKPYEHRVSAAATAIGYVNTAVLNVRTGAGTDKKMLTTGGKKVQLKNEEKVNIIGEKIANNVKWYKVSFTFNKKTVKGYVSSDYITLDLSSKVKATVNSKSSIKIRTGAGDKKPYLKSGKKTVSLKQGKNINIIKEKVVKSKKWFKISFTYKGEKLKGYIWTNHIKFSSPISSGESETNEELTEPITEEITEPMTEEMTEELTEPVTEAPITEEPIAMGTIRQANIVGLFTEPRIISFLVEANGQKVYISEGQNVDILKEEVIDSLVWYKVSFDYGGNKVTGYVQGEYVEVKPQETTEAATEQLQSDDEFTQSLINKGFPQDYIEPLVQLHSKYPGWDFHVMETGLDWNTVIQNESKVGVNLVTNSKNIAWKSLEKGSYNWSTDTFIPYDGSNWVTASKAVVEYYMDPRNFLTEKTIFQFENIAYQSQYQNLQGVEAILKNTPMYNASYMWTENGEVKTMSYAQTFMDAAISSGASPYHLATRVKQEVVTGTSSMSQMVSGTVAGYEGLYNFYNIGATGSTTTSGLLANGLKYAKNGTTNAATNELYLIPWTNPYRAIIGGAQYIASSYIKRGQNTVYLEKFNVTPISTYSHQYMANVEAAYAEAIKTFDAYSGLEGVSVEFYIPVYNNMPSYPCEKPQNALNPNNWLKTLEVEGYNLTPTFDIGTEQVYNLIVSNTTEWVNINATPVNSQAIIAGTGRRDLFIGANEVIINVTAANGNVREYKIYIVRE